MTAADAVSLSVVTITLEGSATTSDGEACRQKDYPGNLPQRRRISVIGLEVTTLEAQVLLQQANNVAKCETSEAAEYN